MSFQTSLCFYNRVLKIVNNMLYLYVVCVTNQTSVSVNCFIFYREIWNSIISILIAFMRFKLNPFRSQS